MACTGYDIVTCLIYRCVSAQQLFAPLLPMVGRLMMVVVLISRHAAIPVIHDVMSLLDRLIVVALLLLLLLVSHTVVWRLCRGHAVVVNVCVVHCIVVTYSLSQLVDLVDALLDYQTIESL